MPFCKIVLTNSLQTFSDQNYGALSYEIPENLSDKIAVGSLVLVPFRSRKENALVIDIYKTLSKEEKQFNIRSIESLLADTNLISQDLVELIKFTAKYYACSYADVAHASFANYSIPKPEQIITLNKEAALESKYESHPIILALFKAKKNQARFKRLQALTGLKQAELKQELRKLETANLLKTEFVEPNSRTKESSNPLVRIKSFETQNNFELNQEQKQVLDEIKQKSKIVKAPKFLLHGVTGSGKTEVYIQLIKEKLQENKSTIFLIPEISLAPQTADRLAARFGEDNVLIWHSALSTKEKNHTVKQLQSKEAKIIVGARSAVFAPVKNLGLIVVDEEHENSYKQEDPSPRYHAHKLVEARAKFSDSVLIYGSATPSVDLYYKASSNEYPDFHLLKIKNRVNAQALPEVQIIDMRTEFNNGNKSVFARGLKASVEEVLERQEQVILFLNKRGNASHVFCRNCGFVYKCSHCDSKIVYHSDRKALLCHHCGYSEAHPQDCPSCGASTIKFFGLGTQKLEELTVKEFPQARIARLDSDVSRKGHHYLEIWQKFKEGEIDILIGTQMIAKGLDLPNLTVVGIVSADGHLSQLDYKADERAFQLLTQVAGRAGRAQKPGKVFLQTYQPQSAIINFAREHNYEDFYNFEIGLRRGLSYPPFGTMLRFRATSLDENLAIQTMNEFHKTIYSLVTQDETISILGPCPCLFTRINDKYRYHIVLKIPNSKQAEPLLDQLKALYLGFKTSSKVNFSIDVDNVSLY